jgi:predicted transcriptional regulator
MNDFYTKDQIDLARWAKALAHPVRVYIMQHLSKQSCCYSGDLAEDLPIARSTLSQHLKELKESGLIQGEINPPKIKYCINTDNWGKAKKRFKNLMEL